MKKTIFYQPLISVRQGVQITIWRKHSVLIRKIAMAVTTVMILIVGVCWLSEPLGTSGVNAQPSRFNADRNRSADQPNGHETTGRPGADLDNRKKQAGEMRDVLEIEALNTAMARLGSPEAPNPPNPKYAKAFRKWQRWISNNRIGAARYAVKRHLESHPDDVNAWSLLIDINHRTGQWRAEIRHLRKMASLTTGSKARKAMFMAAFIAQENGDNITAAQIFKRYLRDESSSTRPMLGEALVRLVYAYRRIGLKEEAQELWRRVLERYASAPLSEQARTMFFELSGQLS